MSPSLTSCQSPDAIAERGSQRPAEPRTGKIMIVDDEPLNIRAVRRHLSLAGYQSFVSIDDSSQAIGALAQYEPDVVLLDILMPAPDGLEILSQIRSLGGYEHLPVLILTASDDAKTKSRALDLGATDFLAKPIDSHDLIPRVRNALLLKAYHDQLKADALRLEETVRERTAELEQSRMAIIQALARAAEYRDNETGRHALRVGRYSGAIARQLGLPEATAQLIELAAPLHDVGKIAIPDSILLKPGKLTPEEMELMQAHCAHGKRIFESILGQDLATYREHPCLGHAMLGVCQAPVLEMAASIALTHHERWDGSGYPLGLAGEDIPIEGRITAIADMLDALSSKRPYKPPFPMEQCFAILTEERGQHFDPAVVDALLRSRPELVCIRLALSEVS